ncbi:MAG: hypothetical protein HKN37_04870 [Rhodothermales bacterium]|nr:hypothetical protein [Rhodothermales bacterium]
MPETLWDKIGSKRVKVRPPHRHSALVLISGVLAFCCGAGMGCVGAAMLELAMAIPLLALAWIAVLLLIMLTYLIWLSIRCQHPVYVVVSSVAFMVMMAIGVFTSMATVSPEFAIVLRQGFGDLGGFVLAAGILGGISGFMLVLFVRVTCVRVIDQDGSLCAVCGYPAGRGGQDRCSECGSRVQQRRQAAGLDHILSGPAGRVRLCAVVVLIVAVGFAYVFLWRVRPYWEFAACVAPAIVLEAQGGALRATRPLASDDRYVLEFWLRRTGLLGPVTLELRVATAAAADSAPLVVTELDQSQTACVLDHGLPRTLVLAMSARAALVKSNEVRFGVSDARLDATSYMEDCGSHSYAERK